MKISLIYCHNKSYETVEPLDLWSPSFFYVKVMSLVPFSEMKNIGVGEESRIWKYLLETLI